MALYTSRGMISHISEVISGTSKNGFDWARQTILLDIPGYQGTTTKLSIQASNDMVNTLSVYNEGDMVEVSWAIYAREWDGKFYNNVDLVKIKPLNQQQEEEQRPARASRPAPQTKKIPPQDLDPAAHEDDLPW